MDLVSWMRGRLGADGAGGGAGPEPAPPPRPGFDLDGRYTLQSLLGRGGASLVFVAEQHSMGRRVALKMLNAHQVRDEAARRRFLREIRAVSRLKSPHTISVFDVGTSRDGVPYIAMELLRGKSLHEVQCASPGPMSVDRAVNLVDQALDSLAEAHAAGVLHRDLKPENLFLLPGQTGAEFLKVLDFGIAWLADDPLGRDTEAGMVLGTPRYMSPEQSSGLPLDVRSDLYSLALILFELLAGRFPFEAPTPVAVAVKKLTTDLPHLRDLDSGAKVPAALESFLRRALSRDPDDRPPDAATFRAWMHGALGEAAGGDAAVRDFPDFPDIPALPDATPARRQDRRRVDRLRRMVSLRFRFANRECRATSLDIGAGGAFLFSRDLPRLGTRIRFACPDPADPDALLHLPGEVVRVVDRPADPGQVQGFAVRWLLPEGMAPPATLEGLLAFHRTRRAAREHAVHLAKPAA